MLPSHGRRVIVTEADLSQDSSKSETGGATATPAHDQQIQVSQGIRGPATRGLRGHTISFRRARPI
jgi:hypothetical protein